MTKTDILRTNEEGEEYLGSSGGKLPNGSWKDKIEWDKIKRIAIIGVAVLFALLMIIYLGILYTPGFSDGAKLTLIHENNLYKLSWESARGNEDDHYIYTIYEGANVNPQSPDSDKKILFAKEYVESEIPHNENNELELVFTSQSFKNKNVTIYLNTIKSFGFIKRNGSKPMIATVNLREPDTYDLNVNIDVDMSRITFSSGVGGANDYKIYLKKKYEDGTPVADQVGSDQNMASLAQMVVSDNSMSSDISFGSDNLTLPNDNEVYTFNMIGQYNDGPLTYYDKNFNSVLLDRDNFLTGKVSVTYTNDGNNRFTLTWNETKGNGYDISVLNSDTEQWELIGHISDKEDRRFITEKLLPCRKYKIRVEAVGTGEDVKDEDRINEVVIQTAASTQYATIWPVTNLTIYKQSTGEEGIGSAEAMKPLTVLDEKDGRFHIKTGMGDNSKEGFIDSNYCMINLPDYMGTLCKYDITNAYSSVYTVAGYGIPMVSGYMIPGYENVLLKDNSFLVPLLYPTAKKLVDAGNKARETGYILKITNTFSPVQSTDYIYNNTKSVLSYKVPAQKFSRNSFDDYQAGKLASVVELSSLTKTDSSASNSYQSVMLNNGEYKLKSILLNTQRNLNIGVAVDLSLVRLKNVKDIKMQTKIHDLSYSSIAKKNNEGAKALSEIMNQSGFKSVPAKWWMFIDNDTRESLNLSPIKSGVSIKGWSKDDKGWRYRKSDGGYYKKTTEKIGKQEYTFDEEGYLVE